MAEMDGTYRNRGHDPSAEHTENAVMDEDRTESATPLPSYVYTALSMPNSIRILHLQPGEGNTQLRGSLRITELTSPPSYEAISYAWCSAERPFQLQLDGARYLPISSSLHEALTRLRWPAKTRRLWVDAVCIAQDDTAEREGQVQLMGDVYKQADRVLCWLGEDNRLGDGAKAIDLIEKIGSVSFRSASQGPPPDELMISSSLPDSGDEDWLSLVGFFNRPWFRRYWVVQEFVLGSRVELICGARTVDWRDMDNGVRKMGEHFLLRWGTVDLSKRIRESLRRELPIAESAIQSLRTIMTMRKQCSSNDWYYDRLNRAAVGDETLEDLGIEFATHGDRMILLFLRQYGQILSLLTAKESARIISKLYRDGQIPTLAPVDIRVPTFPLVMTAFNLRFRLVSDPRDRIFALLGISEEAQDPALRPSYSESVASTYTRFASHLIQVAKSRETLFILLEAGLHSRPAKPTPDLPSWVYDWSQPTEYEEKSLASLAARARCYQAAGESLPRATWSAPLRQLSMAGALVDRIETIVRCPSFLGERDEEGNQVWLLTEDGKFNVDLDDANSVAQWISRTKRLMESDDNMVRDLRQFFAEADSLFLSAGNPLRPSRLDEGRPEILWRTLVAGLGATRVKQLILMGERQWHESEYLRFRRWLATPETSDDQVAAVNSIMSPVAGHWPKMFFNLSQFYAICTTASGWAALVPRCTEPGDEVHIILGANMPVVLRPQDHLSGAHQLVGACYVHGIMRGEFLNDPGWIEKEILLV